MRKISILIALFAIMALLPFACTKGANEAEQTAQNVKGLATDTTVTTSIKTKFAGDDLVSARNIDVDTDNGVVTLHGAVSSQQEADRAFQIASSVEGVRDVRSFLKVGTEQGVNENEKDTSTSLKETAKETGDSIENAVEEVGETAKDATITAAIKMRLAKDDLVKSSDIDVDTENGKVTLNGKVSSPAEEKRAIQIARATNDVRQVQSNLSVQ